MTKQKWTEYRVLAARTESMDSNVESRLVEHGRLVHMIFGLMTEIAELHENLCGMPNIPNLKEEIGDICWYAAIPDIDITAFDNDREEYFDFDMIWEWLGKLTDVAKRAIFYTNVEMKMELIEKNLNLILRALRALVLQYELNFEEILDANIRKLRSRYPEKFDPALAINRDLDAERIALQS